MKTSSPASEPVVSATGLTKIYPRGREQVRALDNLSFEVQRGEFVAVTGASGAGKSTLLNLLGCMDAPSSGQIKLLGHAVENLTERERTSLRGEKIGFVFQHFGLLPAWGWVWLGATHGEILTGEAAASATTTTRTLISTPTSIVTGMRRSCRRVVRAIGSTMPSIGKGPPTEIKGPRKSSTEPVPMTP